MPRHPRHDRGQPRTLGQELREVGVVALPVDRPSQCPRVPVGVDGGQLRGPSLRPAGVLAEPAGPAHVGQPLSDGLVERGGVPRGGQGPVDLVVGACGGEVLFEAGVGGVPHDPEFLQLGRAFAGHGPGPVGPPLVGEPPSERVHPSVSTCS